MIKNEVCEKDGWKCEIVDWSVLFTVLFVLFASIGLAVSEALYQRRSKADFIRGKGHADDWPSDSAKTDDLVDDAGDHVHG